jgi:tRNA G18 (ribose-2'-O)-methylase SpoU
MKRKVVLLAHNIRSLWNVGSFFRSADCFGIERILLSGYSPIPPRREISKTALGAEEWIPWESVDDPLVAIEHARKSGYRIVALEKKERAIPLHSYTAAEKIFLIAGHEVLGVPEALLAQADDVVQILMHGKKESLNVAVAVGIALEHFANA